jgi:hypothetical protein
MTLNHRVVLNAKPIGIFLQQFAIAMLSLISAFILPGLEANIHAGTKYLRFLQDRYFSAQELETADRYLFTFAAYNAGPARVAKKPRRWDCRRIIGLAM